MLREETDFDQCHFAIGCIRYESVDDVESGMSPIHDAKRIQPAADRIWAALPHSFLPRSEKVHIFEAMTRKQYHIRILDGSGCTTTFHADTIESARSQAEAYMNEGNWNADEMGTQHIEYELYVLPADRQYENGDDHHIDADILFECECELLTHTEHPHAPACTEDSHEYEATAEREGGLAENPGVFGVGGDTVIRDHCRHCDLERVQECGPKTDKVWYAETDTYRDKIQDQYAY